MNTDMLSDVSRLSDQDLLARVEALAQRERETIAELVAHLAVLDERRLYLSEGCSSLFTYCTQILHLSEYAAYDRMEVARTVRKYPVILEMLADGSLTLTAVRLLAPELTPANHRQLLESAIRKTKREVLKLVAGLRPQPAVPSTVRQLPTRMANLVFNVAPGTEPPGEAAALQEPTLAIHSPARPVVVPLTPKRFKVQFTADQETHELLERAQNFLRHQIPDGDVAKVVARALKVLVKELEKEKIAATSSPRASRGSDPNSRHIPTAVRRGVWTRDGGRCAFVAHNGRRCDERGFLEFHHLLPYAAGGKATSDNIALRCRAHNTYEAELSFGTGHQDAGAERLL